MITNLNTVEKNELKDYVSDIKRDLMFNIIYNMRHFELTLKDAQSLSKGFLNIFPVIKVQELLRKLQKLGTKHKEARAVFIIYASKYYEKEKQFILQTVPLFIKEGEIEKAINLIKGGTYHE